MNDELPRSESIRLPPEYGSARRKLPWPEVSARLAEASHYWLATVRADCRPHTIPIDGLWVNNRLWFGGSTTSVHHANLMRTKSTTVHVEDAMSPIIVDGIAELVEPTGDDAASLAQLSATKYGYDAPVESFLIPLWRVRPSLILAWTMFPEDATRFIFDDS